MPIDDDLSRDLAALAIPLKGSLRATDDRWQPLDLIDPHGAPVEAVALYFQDLQARGCSDATGSLVRDGSAALVPVPVGDRRCVEFGDHR
ncbi:hypothetical protein [Rhodococcus ruber]|uniref:hypothetical protein n=1 Tax=Rhodococcus ruber TaxID=1830 RepID=UPI0011AB845D|nr:hypothetical protein [Rhodococcus ruber]